MIGPFSSPEGWKVEETTPVFVISVAAELAGMHPQTLRQYDRMGLVSPGRAIGRGRRYSSRDVAVLREIQRLSQDEGVNLAGIKRIMELELQLGRLTDQLKVLGDELEAVTEQLRASASPQPRVFAAGVGGEIVAVRPGRRPRPQATSVSGALVVWRPNR